jgi:hypothetical protein
MIHTYRIHRRLRLSNRPTFAAIHDDAVEKAFVFFGAENPDSLDVTVDVLEYPVSGDLDVNVTVTYVEDLDVEDEEDDPEVSPVR